MAGGGRQKKSPQPLPGQGTIPLTVHQLETLPSSPGRPRHPRGLKRSDNTANMRCFATACLVAPWEIMPKG